METNMAELFLEKQEREKELATNHEKEKEAYSEIQPVPEQEQNTKPLETGTVADIKTEDISLDQRQKEAFADHLQNEGVTLDDIKKAGEEAPCQAKPEREQEEELER